MRRIYYVCKPCAAFVSAFAYCAYWHGAKHICRPCAEPICNLCASHSCFIRFWRKTYLQALRRAYLQALGGILVYWQACAAHPVQQKLALHIDGLCCFGPWFCALPSLCLQALWYHTCRILGVGRLTDTGGLHGYLTSLGGVHHICIWEDLTSMGVPGYLD